MLLFPSYEKVSAMSSDSVGGRWLDSIPSQARCSVLDGVVPLGVQDCGPCAELAAHKETIEVVRVRAREGSEAR